MWSSCVSKLCVWGGRAREEAGVHNQKQEPHTKMGKKGMKIVDICPKDQARQFPA